MPRYQLELFKQSIARLLSYLDRNHARDLCAVFDIGTKATKLLVGPKRAPTTRETWRSSAFFNDGQLFPLGAEFDVFKNCLDVKSSGALEGVCYFLDTYKQFLSGRGMPKENMHAVGTAVFRWMNNQSEVVKHIRKHTGFDIHVLHAKDEAYLSGFSILKTYTCGTSDQDALGEDDVILLFDQGGGSTEVSYIRPKTVSTKKVDSLNESGKLDSLHEFGTVSLQRMFFEETKDGVLIDPTKNRTPISAQFREVKGKLAKRVDEWRGFPEICCDNVKIHAYGMGTAISKCLRVHNIFDEHNRLLTIQQMNETLAKECRELDNSWQKVQTLYATLEQERAAGGKALSDRLVMLYGLPVYQQLLLKFGLDRFRFAGFGLRYGVYLAVCGGQKLENLSSSKADASSKGEPASGRIQVFLSHSNADNELAKKIATSLQEAGYDVWFDETSRTTGDSFIEEIQKGLTKSRFVAVIFSKESLKSEWVKDEWQAKMAEGKKLNKTTVLAIRVDECELPIFFEHRNYSDFRASYESGLRNLLEAINTHK